MSVAQTREYYENVVMTGKGVEKKKKYLVEVYAYFSKGSSAISPVTKTYLLPGE